MCMSWRHYISFNANAVCCLPCCTFNMVHLASAGDKCGDLDLPNTSTVFTYALQPVTIQCADDNGDGKLDWNVCFG